LVQGVWFYNSKYSFITWIAIHNRLTTGDRLPKWNVGASGNYFLRGEEVETRDHLFFSCSYSSQVWSALAHGILDHRFTTSWRSIIPLISAKSTTPIYTFTLRYVFQITIYSLWRERNGRCHGETSTPAHTLKRTIDKNVCNQLSTMALTCTYEGGMRFWFQKVLEIMVFTMHLL